MSESVFTVTEAAGKRIQDLIQRDGKPNLHFRLSVQGGGCSGFQYDMSLGNQMTHEDHVFEVHGVKVVVDDMSLALVAGAELDFVTDLMGASFHVKNPNATATCGCGSSFSV